MMETAYAAMDRLKGSSVKYRKGNSYSTSVRILEAAIQDRLQVISQLHLEKVKLLLRESVLVDLVLQQENLLQHLHKVQAAHYNAAGHISALPDWLDVSRAGQAADKRQQKLLQQKRPKQLTQDWNAFQCQQQQCMQQAKPPLQAWQPKSSQQQSTGLRDDFDDLTIPQLDALVYDIQQEAMQCRGNRPEHSLSDSAQLSPLQQQQQQQQQQRSPHYAELYHQQVLQVQQLQQQQRMPQQTALLFCEKIQQQQQQQQHVSTPGSVAATAHASPFAVATAAAASAAAADVALDAGLPRGNTPADVGRHSLQSASDANRSGSDPHGTFAQVTAADAEAAETAAAPAGGGQYCHMLLMHATPEQWARVMSWTIQDWSEYLGNLVMRLCLLMELLGRLEAMADDGNIGGTPVNAGGTPVNAGGTPVNTGGTPACSTRHTAEDASGDMGDCAYNGAADDASGGSITGTSSAGTAGGAAGGTAGGTAGSTTPDAAAALPTQRVAPAATKQDTLTELEETVDDFVIMVNLCLVFNPIPVRELSCHNTITGERSAFVLPELWQKVNECLQLTDDQVLQLQCGYQQYCRAMSTVQAKQEQLVQAVAASTDITMRVSCSQTHIKLSRGQLQQMVAAAAPTGAAAAAAALPELNSVAAGTVALHAKAAVPAVSVKTVTVASAATRWEERRKLHELLNRHMAGWTAASAMLLQFCCNTLTRLQIARMLIASYPLLPQVDSFVHALAGEPSLLTAKQLRELKLSPLKLSSSMCSSYS